MTTPSGQISAQDIKNEFGETGSGSVSLGNYRVQETRGALTLNIGDGVPGPGQTISYQSMRDKRLNIVVDYYADNAGLNRTDNGDNTMNAKNRYINQNERVRVIGGLKSKPSNTSAHRVRIHVNQSIGGKSGDKNVCALRTGSWNSGTSLIVDVGGAGKIYGGGGRGGDGGNGDQMSNGQAGEDGASALGIDYAGTVINLSSGSLLRCGFGGGGGGGAGFPAGSGGDRGRAAVDGGDGTAGSLNNPGDGGGGGNNHNQAYGGGGGEGGSQNQAADAGAGAQYGSLGGGSEGSAIRKQSGASFTLVNGGSVIGATNQTGVS